MSEQANSTRSTRADGIQPNEFPPIDWIRPGAILRFVAAILAMTQFGEVGMSLVTQPFSRIRCTSVMRDDGQIILYVALSCLLQVRVD
jgi:hypothetical protein